MKNLFFLAVISIFFSNSSFPAHTQRHFPRGCEQGDFMFYEGSIIFNRLGKQSFYLIENRSSELIKLTHFAEPLYPTLDVTLSPLTWSALSIEIKDFTYQCFLETENKSVNCSEVLDICQYPRAKFPTSNYGNYWVTLNQHQEEAVSEAIRQGLYLKW